MHVSPHNPLPNDLHLLLVLGVQGKRVVHLADEGGLGSRGNLSTIML